MSWQAFSVTIPLFPKPMAYVWMLKTVKTASDPSGLQWTEQETTSTDILKELTEKCYRCHPLSPMVCITNCRTWKLKHQIRSINEKLKDPRFMIKIFNTLKNRRRIKMLELVAKEPFAIANLQQELKKKGYHHSEQTIVKDYLYPLIEVGLVQKISNKYTATLFGCRLNDLTRTLQVFVDAFPAHSRCYEETALSILLNQPKTVHDFKEAIPKKSVPRTLNRLKRKKLIRTTGEKSYIYYYRTVRDPKKVEFSLNEKKIYDNIPLDGISTRKLAEKTRISLRSTYRNLKKLKGKKTVFIRRRPKSYALTDHGLQVAAILKKIQELTIDFKISAIEITNKIKQNN